MVNTAGGITGGDAFTVTAEVGADAKLVMTTQAAERAYRAQPSEVGDVRTTMRVATGGCLHWLPQELILYDRCALRRRLDITVARGARLLMVEPVIFGRAAMRERLSDVLFRDRIRIWRDGAPLYIDGIDLSGNAQMHLSRSAIGGGAGAMASLVLITPDAPRLLAPVRALLPATAGASLLCDDLLVLRQLAIDSFEMRRALIPVLDLLTENTLPLSWRL